MNGNIPYKRYFGDVECPKCGKPVNGYPALSRVDNHAYICSDCGLREAFFSINIALKKQG
ncbi:MAG: hypothetical protein Q4C11_00025 [Clostridium sp.]|nr:hypothetical protein [Clostridium sp.]